MLLFCLLVLPLFFMNIVKLKSGIGLVRITDLPDARAKKRGPKNSTLRFPLDSRVTRAFTQSLASTKVVLKVELLLIYFTFLKTVPCV